VNQPRGHEGLDRDASARILREHGIENAVADLIADLVGVAFGDGLRGEEAQVGANRGLRG
jgi:hypothetical protein